MIERIEYQYKDEERRTVKCKPLTIFFGPSGSGKTKALQALRQAFTKERVCETVKVTTNEGSSIEVHGDGVFQLFDGRRGRVVPDAFAGVRRNNPDCVFDPHVLLEETSRPAFKADVERRLLAEIPGEILSSAGVPEEDAGEYRRDPAAYLAARAKPPNEAEARRLRVRLAELENQRRLQDTLAEIDGLLAQFADARKVTQEEINEQNERIYEAEGRFRDSGSDPERRRTLYAEVIRNKDFGDELRRAAQRVGEKMQLEARRASVMNIMAECRCAVAPGDLASEIERTAAAIASIENEGPRVDAQTLLAHINRSGWYRTPVPDALVAVGDGVVTDAAQAGEIFYKGRPLRGYGKLVRTRVCCAIVKWLHPKAAAIVMDDMESLGVPDGVADFIRKLERSKTPVQFFGAVTLDDRHGALAEFEGFLNKYSPEVASV